MLTKLSPLVLMGICLSLICPDAGGDDWPQWRYDAQRSAASTEQLPAKLHVQWVRQYPALTPSWVKQDKDHLPGREQFDEVYRPVVMGKTLFVASSHDDSVTALDTGTGAEKWKFYADGPVRYAPIAANGKVYFGSDDGYLYCLDAGNGKLIWRFRGGPSNRKVLGHERLISCWPIAGGPVLTDGMVYFAAGIWPFEGLFFYALDAETGKVRWVNDGVSFTYREHPHPKSVSFAGPTPQGYLAAIKDKLLVPTGRATVPSRSAG